MNSFLRKGFREYQRQADQRRRVNASNRLLGRVFGSHDESSRRVLMAPLIEVAWADGRVTARESDVLVEIADYYGLTGFEDSFCEFLDAMITRGSVTDSTRNWFRLRKMLTELPSAAFEKVAEALTIQARFMAEQGANNLISIMRGDGFGRDEESVLCKLADELRAIGIAIAEKQASLEATAAPISRNVVGWNEIGTLALPLIVNPRMEDTVAAAG